MVITYVHSEHPIDRFSVHYRCRNMAEAINRTGLHHAHLLGLSAFLENSTHAQQLCNASDLIVIHRYLYGEILSAIQYWKARDKKVIVDLDQAVNYMTSDMMEYKFWHEGIPYDSGTHINPTPIEQFKWGLATVNAATVSSEYLASDWARFVNIHHIPSYINTDQYPAVPFANSGKIRIGLRVHSGLVALEKSGVLTAIKNIHIRYPQIEFIPYGMDMARGKLTPQNFEEWTELLPTFHIGLMSLYGNYDLRSGISDLFEFMISKVPWIASRMLFSTHLSEYGKWVDNKQTAWENSIASIIDQLEEQKQKAGASPHLYILSQDISVQVGKILRAYETIITS